MRAKELREKSNVDLQDLLKEKRSRLEELRFLLSQGKVKQGHEIREIKKDVARILTLLGASELTAN